jgi:uncharacterized protein (TIGR03000 family)
MIARTQLIGGACVAVFVCSGTTAQAQSRMMSGAGTRAMGSRMMMGQSSYGSSSMKSSYGGGGYGAGGSEADYSCQPGYSIGQMLADTGDENGAKKELPHRTGEIRSAPADAAVIKIDLPDASARVGFDGQAVTSAGKVRYFVTPELKKGKEYHYAIQIQWTKNGEQMTSERKITVETGKIAEVNFTATVAAR